MTPENLNFDNFQKKLNDDEEIIHNSIKHRNHIISSNPENALKLIEELYEKYKNHKELKYKYKVLLNLASTLIVLEKYKEAIDKILECIHYYVNINDKKQLTIAIGNTATIFHRLEMYSYAVYLWKLVLTKYIEPNNQYLVNLTINNIMMAHMQYSHKIIYSNKTLEDILYYYKNKKELTRDELYLKLYTKHNLSRCNTLLKNYKEAIEILENLILEYQNEDIIAQQIDVYYDLGLLYKQIDCEEKMIYSYKKVIQIGESIELKLLFSNVYFELYEYYKKKVNYKKALHYIEKYHLYKNHEDELKKKASIFIKDIGINTSNLGSNILNIFNNKSNFDSFLFLEDYNGAIIKIDIFEILYVQKKENVIKIYMSNSDIISAKGTFKKIFSKLASLFPDQNIFFDINSQDTFISLFWISKINYETKRIFIRPFHNEVSFLVSKNQWLKFMNLINHNEKPL
jgi:tetratricopeptide (TPR) repeat protein